MPDLNHIDFRTGLSVTDHGNGSISVDATVGALPENLVYRVVPVDGAWTIRPDVLYVEWVGAADDESNPPANENDTWVVT